MTLPASGQITLNQVNVELSLSGTAQIGMGDAAVRGLFNVSSGQITMANGYGKSAYIPTISAGIYRPLAGTVSHTTSSPSPWGIYYRRTALAYCISKAEIDAVTGGGRGRIVAMGMNQPVSNPLYATKPSYSIALCHVPNGTNTTNVNSSSVTNRSVVFGPTNLTQAVTTTSSWQHTTSPSFSYNGVDGLGVIFAWGQVQPSWNRSGVVQTTTSGRMYYIWTDSAGTYTTTQTMSGYKTYRPSTFLYFNGSV
tara:strand:+ start:362 stop:1117 length:756 start_codon:yes stop_codon:yes gene_type:complete